MKHSVLKSVFVFTEAVSAVLRNNYNDLVTLFGTL